MGGRAGEGERGLAEGEMLREEAVLVTCLVARLERLFEVMRLRERACLDVCSERLARCGVVLRCTASRQSVD